MRSGWILSLVTISAFAQQHSTQLNPFARPADVAEGAKLFRSQCAACHGPGGEGGAAGPTLTTGEFKRGDSDAQLFQNIAKGIPGTTMPGYSGSVEQVWKLAAYVRSLSAGRAAEQAKGDITQGRSVFARSGCGKCHPIAGEGGSIGPDLADIGSRRSLIHLRRSITDPNSEVSSDYWTLRGRTKQGQQISGIRLNEDTFSFQYRDESGLKSVRKQELAEHQLIRTSPMPSFEGKLSAPDLDNVVAYLANLRGEGSPSRQPGAARSAQVSADRLQKAANEPQNWLTYNGTYSSRHYSPLDQIRADNVKDLQLEWVWQARSLEKLETTPLVVDGVMYLTEPPNTIVALDARTARVFWTYQHPLPAVTYPCCGKVNRGLAILDNTLYLGTLDAKLVAVNALTGQKKWERTLADYEKGYAITVAPLAVRDRVILGPAGGELGITGFISAFDARTGKELWRFNTIPRPGEPGHETWGGDSWKHGGGPVWLTGSYDPELNLTYWGTGNPGPDWNPEVRPGDNLYTSSVVALDADTGKLKWHFQFTPHDQWDWDAVQVPVLVDMEWNGKLRKLMLWGNRNGFFYVLDRATGEFLLGKPFVKQTWTDGLDDRGRPLTKPGSGPSTLGNLVWPGVQGGTNWFAPSYSERTGMFYLTGWPEYSGTYFRWDQEYEAGKWYAGGAVRSPVPAISREGIYKRGRDTGYGSIMALNPRTGEKAWSYDMTDVSESGLLTTGSDLLFSGNREGHFFALNAKTGELLWRRYLGGQVAASPITYTVDGRQFVSIAVGNSLFTFALPVSR